MIQTAKNSLVLLFFAGLFFQSCNKNDVYAAKIKTLDSLSGAVNTHATEMNKIDTVILAKAILRFEQYKQFIQQNVKDTVTKSEADFIQQFYTSGKSLAGFDLNRRSLKARTSLINSQLEKLKSDAKNNLLPEEKLMELYEHATNEAHDALVIDGTGSKIVFKKNFNIILKFD